MAKIIQFKVPNAVHRRLKARANRVGLSLADYVLSEIKEFADKPTLAEMRIRLHRRKPILVAIDTARMVREERDAGVRTSSKRVP